MWSMIITKETDYARRLLRVLLDGEKHSVAEMSETELIPNQFAYQILRKLSAGNLVYPCSSPAPADSGFAQRNTSRN